MAITYGPDVSPSAASGPIASVRCRGILTLALTGGNHGWFWRGWQLDEAVEMFEAGTVPLLDSHNETDRGAPIVGVVTELARCDEGIRFVGTVTPAMAARLGYRGAHVSAELRHQGDPSSTHGRATIDYPGDAPSGLLVAVAILSGRDRPARAGSCIWVA